MNMRIHPAASLPDSREAPDLAREVNLFCATADQHRADQARTG
jgi:hypothetical protein